MPDVTLLSANPMVEYYGSAKMKVLSKENGEVSRHPRRLINVWTLNLMRFIKQFFIQYVYDFSTIPSKQVKA